MGCSEKQDRIPIQSLIVKVSFSKSFFSFDQIKIILQMSKIS